MLISCEFIGWCNLSHSEQIALASAIFTGFAFLGTACYVWFTYDIMDSNRESVKMLAEKEKPFLCITNITPAREVRHKDGISYHLWEVTVANGGITNGIVKNISVALRTFKISETHTPAVVPALPFVESIIIAPNHDRTFLCGFSFEFTGDVANQAADLTAEVTIGLDYDGIGTDSYSYSYTGEYFKRLARFVGKNESHIEH
jgi:hypothetical protein